MPKIHKLLAQISAQENALLSKHFLAPCLQGCRLKIRVAQMIYQFNPLPSDFSGWGIFRAKNEQVAELIEEADYYQISEYLGLFPSCRLHLAYCLQDKTWLAYPVNEADFKQRFLVVKPVPVNLVLEGGSFEQILARFDGQVWWFEEIDRRSEPELVSDLKNALQRFIKSKELSIKGITPEVKTVYKIVSEKTEGFAEQADTKILKKALNFGGGKLKDFQDKGNYWTVNWTTSDGQLHTSAIAKKDLTVMSSGICLSGRDRDFDLQSLVGVIEHR